MHMQNELHSAGLESHTLHTVEVCMVRNGLMDARAQKHGTVHRSQSHPLQCYIFLGLPFYFVNKQQRSFLWPANIQNVLYERDSSISVTCQINHLEHHTFQYFLIGKNQDP